MQPWKEKSERAREAARKKWADAKADAKADAINEDEVNKVNKREEEVLLNSTTPVEIKNLFLRDIGLRNAWVSKGLLKEEYENGVQIFVDQRLKEEYKKGDNARSHFIYWMPNYHKAIEQRQANNSDCYANGTEVASKYDY